MEVSSPLCTEQGAIVTLGMRAKAHPPVSGAEDDSDDDEDDDEDEDEDEDDVVVDDDGACLNSPWSAAVFCSLAESR